MKMTIVLDASGAHRVLDVTATQVKSILADYRAELVHAARLSLQDQMESSGGAEPWEPLSENTVRHRGDLNDDALGGRGEMFQSLTTDDGPWSVDSLDGDGVLRIGSDDPVAGWFSEGTRHQPARHILTQEVLERMADATVEILNRWPDLK